MGRRSASKRRWVNLFDFTREFGIDIGEREGRRFLIFLFPTFNEINNFTFNNLN
jgi:hypothetical protein